MHFIRINQDKKPFFLLGLTAFVTLSVFAFFFLLAVKYSKLTEDIMQSSIEIEGLRGEIIYLNEGLSMSARLAVLTGNPEWAQRYGLLESRLEATITKAAIRTKALFGTDTCTITKTGIANEYLIKMEHDAFSLLTQGKPEDARKILFSEEYTKQKDVYAEGMAQLDNQLSQIERDALASGSQYYKSTMGVVPVAIILLTLLWYYVLQTILKWRKDLLEANIRLERQSADLATGAEALQREIAQRMKAEMATSHFFDVSLDLLCIASFDGYFKRLNPAWEKTFGWSIEELCASPFVSFVHPDDVSATLSATKVLIEGSNIVGFENRYRCKDGSWRWILWQSVPSPEEGLIYAVAHDFTERRQAETAKKQMVEHTLEFDRVLLQLRKEAAEDIDVFLPLATENCAQSLNVERVSIWLLDETGEELRCHDLYERTQQTHSSGAYLLSANYPHYFEALTTNMAIVADDAMHNPATSEFTEDYLSPLGIGAMLDVPLLSGSRLIGVLCCEHVGLPRQWTVQEQKFAIAIASHVMLAIEAAQRHQALESLAQREEMLNAIHTLHKQFLLNPKNAIRQAFDTLLSLLLHATQSEYGFTGEVLYTEEGQPYLKIFSLSNITWDDESRCLYEENKRHGLEFHNLKSLIGSVITSGETVISNSPDTDPRRGGLPAGHPPLKAFLGIPIKEGARLIGMVGIANRSGGYDKSCMDKIEPLMATASSLVLANQSEQRRLVAEAELRSLNDALEVHVKERTAQLDKTVEDLKQQENQLKLFRNLLDQSSDGIYIVDPSTSRLLDVNETACQKLGYKREEMLELGVIDIQTNIQDITFWQTHVEEIFSNNAAILEFEALRKDGGRFPIEASLHGVTDGNQKYIIAMIRDITERKRSEKALRCAIRVQHTLSSCNATLIHATEEKQLLTDMCRTVIKEGGYRFVWIGFVENDDNKTVRPVASAGHGDGYLESRQFSWADNEHGQGPIGRAVRLGDVQIAVNILADPQFEPWRVQALKYGYASSIALPLKKDNKVFAVLSICAAEANAFDEAEVALLRELADDLAFGIITLRMREERNHYQIENLKNVNQLKESLICTIRAIALTVEKRDPYTAGHQTRVADLSAAIASELGLDTDTIEGLRLGATIHDIGKIYIPAEILNRPGQLSINEFGMIKSHPDVGYDIIKDVKFPWPVAEMVLQHHERMDGSGYPKGLKEEEIILEARILAVADVVEAITSHRPYRPALGVDIALAEIKSNRGTFYDADVVDACLKLFLEKGYTFEH